MKKLSSVHGTTRNLKVISSDLQERRLLTSNAFEADLKRLQEVLRTSSIEETLHSALRFTLKHKDPVAKAQRNLPSSRKVLSRSRTASRVPSRGHIPAAIRHRVFARDLGKCQFKSCGERRWTEVHHVRPLHLGGTHALENLTTLCSGHHKRMQSGLVSRFEHPRIA